MNQIFIWLGQLGGPASLIPCDYNGTEDNYAHRISYFNLQFLQKKELEIMEGDIALSIVHAENGDLESLKAMLDVDKELLYGKDWDDYTVLHAAAFEGQTDVVQYLLGKGADANEVDSDGITALMKAAVRGHIDVVKVLVEAGADIDATGNSDITAAWLAAGEGQHEVLKYLVGKGASVHVKRSDGVTPLMNACTGTGPGQFEVIQILMSEYNGESEWINAQTVDDGLTALIRLSETPGSETLPSIKLLVENGADVNIASSLYGYSALMMAAANGYTETVEYLLSKGANVNHQTKVDQSFALMYAATSGHIDIVKLLIDAGADVNLKYGAGGTVLSESALTSSIEIIDILLAAGADASAQDDLGVTALMMAASSGNQDICERLIDSNGSSIEYINKKAQSGAFALFYAAGSGRAELVKYLISKGADAHATAEATSEYNEKLAEKIANGDLDTESQQHIDGMNIIHVAAQSGFKNVIEAVLSDKSNSSLVNTEDSEGRSPLVLAVRNNYGSTASLLLENGADPNVSYTSEDEGDSVTVHNLLMDALIVENEDFAQLLIAKGARLDFVDEEGGNVSLLLQASHRGLSAVVKDMLQKVDKKYIEFVNDEGVTPLLAAASEGHVEVFNELINSGANVNHQEKDGTSVLSAAAARGHLDVVLAALKVKGVDVNSQNSDGHTALMFAYNGKNQVETLWERYQLYVAQQDEDEASGDDETTKTRIIEALERHNKLISAIIGAGADESLKDKEGHVAKDFDFVAESELNAEVLEAERNRKTKGNDEL